LKPGARIRLALHPVERLAPLTLALALAAPLPGCAQSDAPDLDRAREAARAGRYEEAIASYEALVRADLAFPAAPRELAVVLAAVGRHPDAIDGLRETAARRGGTAELARMLGVMLAKTGDLAGAEDSFRRSIEANASDALLARLELGRLLYHRGEHDPAMAIFDGFIDAYNAGGRLSAEELASVGAALTYLGIRDPALFHDAVRAYEEAIEADPGDAEIKVRLGELFLAKYDSREAGGLFTEVLEVNPAHAGALLGMARRAKFDGSSESIDLARRSLESNPSDATARAFLAHLYLDLEDVESAEEEARRAIEANPSSVEAWVAMAAVAHLTGDSDAFSEASDRIFSLDSKNTGLHNALAEISYRNHRYEDAVGFARQAIARDPLSWESYSLLGLNLLRVGGIEEGRETLEAAFEGDPYNVWVKNTLDLLDGFERFRETSTPRFLFLVEEGESDLLSTYAPELAEEAFDRMAERYGYGPPTPIRIEIYPRHADFSVRTVGLAGLGALGVSFGSVLAMDSPAARSRGEFNWGSTMWHEISHAFTLGYTEHRVPRWLSEGLAVLDERHARPGWGSDVAPDFLVAFREGRLPSLKRFNYGFVRPRYPRQVQHSYYLASLLCEMIEEEEGFDAIRRMLDGYRDGLDTEAVFDQVFGADLEAFDGRLERYVRLRFGDALSAVEEVGPEAGPPDPDGFAGQVRRGAELLAAGRAEEAIPFLERARSLFPEYAGPDAPGLMLARIHRDAGRTEEAAIELRAYTALNENHYEAHVELADLEQSLGDPAAAADALRRAVWIDPYDLALHETLADLYEQTDELEGAVLEHKALLALDPVDRAQTLYRLARAHHRAGQADEARRAVLSALEIAPGYEAALDLLLDIRGEPPRR
jgi:tetratricopeptide (TPR) repeat protein